jgi:integrase
MPGRQRPDSKIPTENPQGAPAGPGRNLPAAVVSRRRGRLGGKVVSGTARAGSGGRTVIETPEGITVYPARHDGGRWRAVWYENGQRQQCQAASEDRLAGMLEKVTVRLTADAPNMLCAGNDLIAFYLSADRRPADRPWSRKHAETQRYLCERYLRPWIGNVACQDIRTTDMQAVVNAAPTAKEGWRVRAMISALTGAGLAGGYLASPRLKEVHWQANGRVVEEPRAVPAGEGGMFVDPGEIPAAEDVAKLGQALRAKRGGLYELMVCFAAYTGLRWGEIAALTAAQVSPGERGVLVDRKVVEIRGHLFVETPKNRKWRRTIYPRFTPWGWPLADVVTARIEAVRQEQEAGTNPLGLMFPAPAGGYWRTSNFRRRVLEDGYLTAGWRAAGGIGWWTWHSLRHVFCTVALFGWGLEVTDVARLAGHANHRITWEMYVGSTAGTLDRALAATAGPQGQSPALAARTGGQGCSGSGPEAGQL